MEFQVLKRGHLKRNIIIGVAVVTIISVIILNFTRAKYQITESISLVNGTINYRLADLNVIAITVDGESTDTIPDGNYELTENSYCTVNGEKDSSIELSYDSNTKTLNVIPFTKKGTKCYLDFKQSNPYLGRDYILSKTSFGVGVPNFANTSCSNGCQESTNGLYTSTDDSGTTYYFRGTVDNNWVKFADFYWRIVRINGDGSIRLIYNGSSTSTTGDSTHIGNVNFNLSDTDNMYVGYMYSAGEVHGLENSSNMKSVLENWYKINIQDKSFSKFVSKEAGFCGDRTPSTSSAVSNGLGGTGNITTYYGAFIRLFTSKNPSFLCNDVNDLYTVVESSKGNQSLTYPIGLITADEVAFAGNVVNSSNSGYYLYNGVHFWTMTPYSYINSDAYKAAVFMLASGSSFGNGMYFGTVSMSGNATRPVINLRGDLKLTGSGTISAPYVISS